MAAPYKTGGRIQPHRERAKAATQAAARALNDSLEPLQTDPPEYLTDGAKAAWREYRPLLHPDIVRQADVILFGITCILLDRMRRDELSENGNANGKPWKRPFCAARRSTPKPENVSRTTAASGRRTESHRGANQSPFSLRGLADVFFQR